MNSLDLDRYELNNKINILKLIKQNIDNEIFNTENNINKNYNNYLKNKDIELLNNYIKELKNDVVLFYIPNIHNFYMRNGFGIQYYNYPLITNNFKHSNYLDNTEYYIIDIQKPSNNIEIKLYPYILSKIKNKLPLKISIESSLDKWSGYPNYYYTVKDEKSIYIDYNVYIKCFYLDR